MTSCEVCARELPPSPRGRPARYCSRACRARAYRDRVADRAGTGGAAPVQADLVGDRPGPDERVRADPAAALTAERVVRAAIALADRDGGDALSMRNIAAELGVGVMSLYRHVSSRDDLGERLIDAVFGDRALPWPGPAGWRAKLELSAREEWAIFRAHPWVAQLFVLTTRPPVAPRLMAYTEWRIRALDGFGVDAATAVRIAIMISTHTQGAALPLAREQAAASTREEWMQSRRARLQQAFHDGTLTRVASFDADAFLASEPGEVFEFGLQRLLDGVQHLVASRPDRRPL